MKEVFRQGSGKHETIQRRVDIGRGRLIAPERQQARHEKIVAKLAEVPRNAVMTAIVVLILAIAAMTLTGCASQASAPTPAVKNSIEIESIRLTAAGHFVDLRYRVLDAKRANEVLGPGVKPLLIDEASGTVMAVPTTAKLGSLRQTRGVQRPDRSYFVLFVNSARLKPGSRVTAEIGDMTFENLIIE
jgi:hypothetical protein